MNNTDQLVRESKIQARKWAKSENEFEACQGRIHLELAEKMIRWIDSEGKLGTPDIVQQAAMLNFMSIYLTHMLFWLYGADAMDEMVLKDYTNAIIQLMRDNAQVLLNSEAISSE